MKRFTRLSLLFWAGLLGCCQITQADPITFTFTVIDVPGSTSTSAYGINNAGQIVGAYTDSTGVQRGFLDTNGVFTTLPFVPTGINNVSQIVGFSSDGVFLDTNGVITDIAVPGFSGYTIDDRYLVRINDLGQIVGTFFRQSLFRQAFLYSDGAFTFFPAPTYEMEGPLFSANKINNAGQIVIQQETGQGATTLLYDSKTGQYTSIFPSNPIAYGTAINNLGQVIASNPPGVFLYTNGVVDTYRFLNPGLFPYDLNDRDQIVGGNVLATPVPEPAALLLLAGGVALLGLLPCRYCRH